METQKLKWYDNKVLLIALFFLLPPLGIYAMLKHKTETWKKLLYILPACLLILFTMVGIIGAILMDSYKDGMDYYNKRDYVKSYNSFKLVNPDNDNYDDAISKIQELKPIIDSLNLIKENRKLAEKEDEIKLRLEKENQKNLKENQKKLKENPSLEFPQIQQDFITIIRQSREKYKDAPNELKKSAIRTERGKLVQETLENTRMFSDWICIVKDMQTTGKGKAMFEVEIEGSDVKLGTMIGEFTDLFTDTLIEQSDPLYDVISELKKGDKVRIGGIFMKSDKNDFIQEMSITEKGSINEPDYVVKFVKIQKI